MDRRPLFIVLAILVAGCTGSSSPASEPSEPARPSAVATETKGAIQGLVTDADVNPIVGAMVGASSGPYSGSTNSSEDGTFAFAELEPGAYTIFASKLGYNSVAVRANVSAGRVTPVHVNLTALEVTTQVELRLDLVKTQGGWFQVPYPQAQARVPAGFRAKPHVLAEPNEQTAEVAVYVTSYNNGTFDGKPIEQGSWVFEVLNVEAPSAHASGATVEFVVLASYASDPTIQTLFSTWNVPTTPATISFSPGDAGASTFRGVSSVQQAKGTYQLTTANSQGQEALTGSSLSVRLFGVVEGTVVSYVDIDITGVQYSISGAAQIDGAAALAMAPTAPAGEGYMQWGTAPIQTMTFLTAKKA